MFEICAVCSISWSGLTGLSWCYILSSALNCRSFLVCSFCWTLPFGDHAVLLGVRGIEKSYPDCMFCLAYGPFSLGQLSLAFSPSLASVDWINLLIWVSKLLNFDLKSFGRKFWQSCLHLPRDWATCSRTVIGCNCRYTGRSVHIFCQAVFLGLLHEGSGI